MKFFVLVLAGLFVAACKPKKNDYTIKGKLINNCDNSAIANIKVQARQTNTANGFNAFTYSNSEGNFELLASTAQKSTFRFLNLNDEIPVDNYDLGNIPLYSNSNIYYKIKIYQPHQISDTLSIYDISKNVYYKMAGPFHDTDLGIKTVTTINRLRYDADSKTIQKYEQMAEVQAWYLINNVKSVPVYFPANTCGRKVDTLTLAIF